MRISDWSSDVCSSDLVSAVLLEFAFLLYEVGNRERHTHLLVQREGNARADLEAVTDPHLARYPLVHGGAYIVEGLFKVVGVGKAAEQHCRIEGLDQRAPEIGRASSRERGGQYV